MHTKLQTSKYTYSKTIDCLENLPSLKNADLKTGYWQWFPTDSLKADQPTTAKFLVDDENLYILVTSYSEASEYIVPSLRRDYSGAGNDNITLVLDTFMDGTNGFMFGTNPLGVKRESLVSNGGNNYEKDYNKSWDVKWETEPSQQNGFTVSEIKISRPDKVLLVDYPGFNLRLVKKIKNLDLSKISFIEKGSKYQKKICVMGQMGELGEKSEDLHKYILKEASSIFDVVLAIDFKVNLTVSNISFFKREEIDSYLKEYLEEDALIFFKGSRSVKMENIIKNLT